MIIFLVGVITTKVSAQTDYDRVTIGIKGGLNISKMNSNSPSVKQKSMSSLQGGIFVSMPLSKNFYFQPELNYARMGGKYNFNTTRDVLNFDWWGAAYARFEDELLEMDLQYIDLPLIIKYKVPKIHLSLLAGPQISYLLSAKVIAPPQTIDIKGELNEYDIRGLFGLEYKLPKGFAISGRYQLGLLNIPKNGDANSEFKNNAFSFTLGYTLDSK